MLLPLLVYIFISINLASTSSPVDCFGSGTTLYDVFNCLRVYIIPRGHIQNEARFGLIYPTEQEITAYTGVVKSMLESGQCPMSIPEIIAPYIECATFRNKYSVLFEMTLSRCRALEANGTCSMLSDGSYFLRGWGFFAVPISGSGASSLHLSAAHPISDGTVGLQAVYLFENTNARSVTVTGSRRDSYLDKQAGNCQTSNYPADAAHNKATMFHQTLLMTAEWQLAQPGGCPWSTCAFLQLHGMKTSSCTPDTVFMSTGLGRDLASLKFIDNPGLPLRRLQKALKSTAPSTWNINTPAESSCSLVARTNVFGRLLNGVQLGSECKTYALTTEASGYFIHVEQIGTSQENLSAWKNATILTFNSN